MKPSRDAGRMKTLAWRLLVSAAVVTTGVLGTATAAQALPADCQVQVGTPADGATVWCARGTGEYRAAVECLVMKPGDPFSTFRYGPWVNIQAYSSIDCPGGPRLVDAWYEVR